MTDKRVFFHVGAPKTGTTYLQNVLFQNRETLAANGVLYPYEDRGQSFRSMQDFREAGWGGGRAADFAGEWEMVASRVRDWTGPSVIVSNELLGGSRPARIEAGLATVQPSEIHIIFSARDFARQLVSDWQEHIKHKHTVTLEQFVDDLVEYGLDAPPPFGELFWGMHDAAYVLERWAQFVPVERIHVVTVPQPGAPRDTLWHRFCEVTGMDPDLYDSETPRANASMGVAETELVRRMNAEVQGMAPEHYDPLVRQLLAEDVLGGRSARLMLPPGRMDWVVARSELLISQLTSAGYQVTGDLAELLPRPDEHAGFVSPTEQTDADLADAAIRAATGLLRHAGRQRRRNMELTRQITELTSDAEPRPVRKRTPQRMLRGAYARTRSAVGRAIRRLGLKGRAQAS